MNTESGNHTQSQVDPGGDGECRAKKGRGMKEKGTGKACFSPVKFSAGGSVVKSKKPLELRETWILVAGLRLTHWMTLGKPYRFLDLDFPTALERGCKR